jgi:hypothetical protein
VGNIHARMLAMVVAVGPVACARAAPSEHFACPDVGYATPVKVPDDLVPRVAEAFQVEPGAVRNAAFVRCANDRLVACYVGANLNCFKADRRRTLPGATSWCREHAGSTSIPMFATGHETIYEWSCQGKRAVPGKRVTAVDAQGYVAGNWREIR